MKFDDLPMAAFSTPPVDIPVKVVPDWDALYELLLQRGFIVLHCPTHKLRTTNIGAAEAPNVKAFNNHIRITRKKRLLTKRMSQELWFCTLAKENP